MTTQEPMFWTPVIWLLIGLAIGWLKWRRREPTKWIAEKAPVDKLEPRCWGGESVSPNDGRLITLEEFEAMERSEPDGYRPSAHYNPPLVPPTKGFYGGGAYRHYQIEDFTGEKIDD